MEPFVVRYVTIHLFVCIVIVQGKIDPNQAFLQFIKDSDRFNSAEADEPSQLLKVNK